MDILERLRDMAGKKYGSDWSSWVQAQCSAAADEIQRLRKDLESERKTNAVLRRDLADPPGDIQELVLQKLGLMAPVRPLIELGKGLVEVGEGHLEGVPALIFGTKGTGTIGEPTRDAPGFLPHKECLAVVTFGNVESLDVVLWALNTLRQKMMPAIVEARAQEGHA